MKIKLNLIIDIKMEIKNILHKRKMNYSLLEILKSQISLNQSLDELIILNDIVRICSENNIPFKTLQIKKVFKKIYKMELHGSKLKSWEFLSKWSSERATTKENLPSLLNKKNEIKRPVSVFSSNVVQLNKTKEIKEKCRI